MSELQLRRGGSVRAIEIKFRGRWHLLGSLVGTRWRYPDQGKNKEFEALSEEAMPILLAAPTMLAALEAVDWGWRKGDDLVGPMRMVRTAIAAARSEPAGQGMDDELADHYDDLRAAQLGAEQGDTRIPQWYDSDSEESS